VHNLVAHRSIPPKYFQCGYEFARDQRVLNKIISKTGDAASSIRQTVATSLSMNSGRPAFSESMKVKLAGATIVASN
jgi:hypothetical protein